MGCPPAASLATINGIRPGLCRSIRMASTIVAASARLILPVSAP
jgi:hypothetical protein